MFPLLSGGGLFYISFWEVLLPVLYTNTFFFNCLGKRSSQWPGCGHDGGGKSFSNQTIILK